MLGSGYALVVGGGVGMAPLRFLVHELLKQDSEVALVIAARTKRQLLLYDFHERRYNGLDVSVATDDGTAGIKGVATDAVKLVLGEKNFDTIYACGPEMMLVGLLDVARENSIGFQASLERIMKCGCGICGTCAMESGMLVCIDGPVFTGEELERMSDFGAYCRDHSGACRYI